MAELTEKVLKYLETKDEANTLDIAKYLGEDHQKIVGAVKSIQASGDLITSEQKTHIEYELTPEGEQIANKGSHEAVLYNAIPTNGIAQDELMKLPNAKVGFSKAMSAGWISVDRSGDKPLVKRQLSQIVDTVQAHLKQVNNKDLSQIDNNLKQEYKKRKLLQENVLKSYILKKGPNFSLSVIKLETDLTSEMLASGFWKHVTFKDYNMDARGAPPDCGALHPISKVRTEIRQIFLEMGFSEMPTNNYVESSFWNFDALYQPQQHPARDAHDTFFISDPPIAKKFPMEYLEKVKTVHSVGGYGSIGYRYDWKFEEAEKNLLRTHTTANTARLLHKLAQAKEFKPVKFFSIDKVYRNETLDATHLAEFHQVEGVIADHKIALGNLIGVLDEFFKKLGISKLQFKPAYNPYTEPSMEIFCFHEGLGRWIECGNSGMFRAELVRPTGLPEDVSVIGFGLSLERPTMIKYGYNNIRDLVGPKVDLEMVHNTPLCRLDK